MILHVDRLQKLRVGCDIAPNVTEVVESGESADRELDGVDTREDLQSVS